MTLTTNTPAPATPTVVCAGCGSDKVTKYIRVGLNDPNLVVDWNFAAHCEVCGDDTKVVTADEFQPPCRDISYRITGTFSVVGYIHDVPTTISTDDILPLVNDRIRFDIDVDGGHIDIGDGTNDWTLYFNAIVNDYECDTAKED